MHYFVSVLFISILKALIFLNQVSADTYNVKLDKQNKQIQDKINKTGPLVLGLLYFLFVFVIARKTIFKKRGDDKSSALQKNAHNLL